MCQNNTCTAFKGCGVTRHCASTQISGQTKLNTIQMTVYCGQYNLSTYLAEGFIVLSQDKVSKVLEPTASPFRDPHCYKKAIREIPNSQASSCDFITSWVLSHSNPTPTKTCQRFPAKFIVTKTTGSIWCGESTKLATVASPLMGCQISEAQTHNLSLYRARLYQSCKPRQ